MPQNVLLILSAVCLSFQVKELDLAETDADIKSLRMRIRMFIGFSSTAAIGQ